MVNNIFRRAVRFVLSGIAVACMSKAAAIEVTVDNVIYSIGNVYDYDAEEYRDLATVDGLVNPDVATVNIRETVEYDGKTYVVYKIWGNAFSGNTSITEFDTGDSVQIISENAFSGCTALRRITIGKSVQDLGQSTFKNCESLKELYYNAVYIQSANENINPPVSLFPTTIDTVVFGEDVSRVPAYLCVRFSNLKKVILPNSVQKIGAWAFTECSSLAEVEFGNSLTTIDGFAFSWCDVLSGVKLPESLTYIGAGAFSRCPMLDEIIIPDSVTVLGPEAFKKCTNLKNVVLSNSLTTIYPHTFEDCGYIGRLVIPDGITEIAEWAFGDMQSIGHLTIGKSVAFIGEAAFQCNVDTLVLNAIDMGEPEKNALPRNIQSLTIGENVTKIYKNMFSNSNDIKELHYNAASAYSYATNLEPWIPLTIEKMTIGSTVRRIPDYIFENCVRLKEVTISDGVEEIGTYAFYNCRSLSNLNLGNSVKIIRGSAFSSCESLTSVSIPRSVTQIGSFAFDGNYLEKVTYNAENANLDSGWARYETKIRHLTIGKDVKEVDELAFKYFTSLESVVFNAQKCSKFRITDRPTFTTLTVGDDAEVIPAESFSECYSLNTVTFGNSLREIGEKAFFECNNIKEVKFPESLVSIGGWAFFSCSQIAELTIPDNVTTVGMRAFCYCDNVTSLTLGESISTLGEHAFLLRNLKELYYNCCNCSRLTSALTVPEKIVIGKNVKKLSEKCFYLQSSAAGEIYSLAVEPPEAHDNTFTSLQYENFTLYVPEGSIEKYRDAWNCWYLFKNINATSGVGNIIVPDSDRAAETEVFNMAGELVGSTVEGLALGLYIIRQGKTVSKYVAR